MNKIAVESLTTRQEFEVSVVNVTRSREIADIGKLSARKIYESISVISKTLTRSLRFRPDVAYVTIAPAGPAFYRDAIAVALLRATGARLVFHLHGQGVAASVQRGGWRRALYSSVFRGAEVIVVSDRVRKDIADLVPAARTHVLPNGIIDPFTTERPNRRERLGPPRILYLSNMVESKGPLVLLQALAALKAEDLRFTVDYAGAWSPSLTEAAFVQAGRRLDVLDRVSLHGPVYGEQKLDLLRRADLLALPTYFDAFPLVLLEAMAAGLPVVSTLEGGIPGIVQNESTGILVPPKDVRALAGALRRLIADEELRIRMGVAARLRFAAKFTAECFRERLVEVLAACCARPPLKAA